MSSLKLKGSTSGDVTMSVPAVAGTNTITIPASTGTMALTSDIPSVPTTVVKQIVHASDATLYSISVTNTTSDHAGSIAYSITPTSASNDIIVIDKELCLVNMMLMEMVIGQQQL